MTSGQTLPLWLQYVQVAGTIAVSIWAAILGFLQWKTAKATANLKVFFDLHDRRSKLRSDLNSLVTTAQLDFDVSYKLVVDFKATADPAFMLFGPEVKAFLDKTATQLLRLHELGSAIEHRDGDVAKLAAARTEVTRELTEYSTNFDKLALPYLQMPQKL